MSEACWLLLHQQAAIKPQYVDQIPRAVKGTVQAMLDRKDELKNQDVICRSFGRCTVVSPYWCVNERDIPTDLELVRGRNIEDLSGGELQRFACAVLCVQRADM